MKLKTSAFTLVELIVVITILAILGTIAFISLQGYSQDAKNSKVSSDLRTLVSAIESASTESDIFTITDLVTDIGSHGTAVSSGTFASGALIGSGVYNVGNVNFPFIKQNNNDFVDSEENQYIAAIIYDPSELKHTYYQIVGQTKNEAGTYDAIVKGTYLKIGEGDINGLVAAPGYPNGVNNDSIGIASPGIY
ncbi:type II secretion system GspH family protein [Candidatus Gracilibacteria bacterium]|nr:type II secretion system GspH family protein [Candidatus Gracilibacteria bacterium]